MGLKAEERKLNMLTAKKATLFSMLQTTYELAKDLDNAESREKFRKLVKGVPSTKKQLLELVDEVVELNLMLDANYTANYDILVTVDAMCAEIEDSENFLRGDEKKAVTTPGAQPRLPKVELPSFSGGIAEWEAFYGVFLSLIHENKSLADADKLYYLVGCLRGSARSVCSGVPLAGENYRIVWNTLVERYQDKRVLAKAYLEQMRNFKSMRDGSETGLQAFLEEYSTAVKALKNLKLGDLGDFIVTSWALEKLGPEIAQGFEMSRNSAEIPVFEEVENYVIKRVKASTTGKGWTKPKEVGNRSGTRVVRSFVVKSPGEASDVCGCCRSGDHGVRRCETFKGLSAAERYNCTKKNGWCFNCLSEKHAVRFCPSESRCGMCQKKHHTLLHGGRPEGGEPNSDRKEQPTTLCASTTERESDVLLGTAVVDIGGIGGLRQTGRFLLDSGSQATLITTQFCRKLGLPISRKRSSVQALGGTEKTIQGTSKIQIIIPGTPEMSHWINSLVLDEVTGKIPQSGFKRESIPGIENLRLADSGFHMPGKIDGILGADIVAKVIGSNHLQLGDGLPTAVETRFGYVLMGGIAPGHSPMVNLVLTEMPPLEDLVRGFWELERVPEKFGGNAEEQECENHFRQTVSRDEEGRFTVALPFRKDPTELGESFGMARKRFFALEKRLDKNPDMKTAYVRAINDFIEQGHLSRVEDERSQQPHYIISHHAVHKPESTSTPVRIVLDASAPTSNGVSLNNILHEGPKLQLNIFELLVGFRLFSIAMTADLRQMYRQINVRKNQRRFQRILWREEATEQLEMWELKPLAFGLSSSPYLALRTVQQLIEEEKADFPEAAELLKTGIYMDDIVVSLDGMAEAVRLHKDFSELFSRGQFTITKWSSNAKELLEKIPMEERLGGEVLFKADTKILGTVWDPKQDELRVKFPVPAEKCTKREILSAVARCYDPLGVTAPLILYLKVLIKELWKLKLDWDETAPGDIRKKWSKVMEEWSFLGDVRLKRHVGGVTDIPMTLYGFADASKDGYGAVIYGQSEDTGKLTLMCAKSRVSPMKEMTIPRLELCAALLLSNLMKVVRETLEPRLRIKDIWAFSDSTTVLQWLTSTGPLDSFVANRVAKIRGNNRGIKWNHIAGTTNPADCLSRGLTPRQLVENSLWWTGPNVGQLVAEYCLPETTELVMLVRDADPEAEDNPLLNLVTRKSSWMAILRIICWVRRLGKRSPRRGEITIEELREAERALIRVVQRKYFDEDWRRLKSGKEVSHGLRNLRPFLQNEVMRVGGRLANSGLAAENIHPIILPKRGEVTKRLIDYLHRANAHAGPHLLEAIIRQKYWIVGAKSVIKGRVRKCNGCFRVAPRPVRPLMGNLPECRVSPGKAFLRSGVDYFGPVDITTGRIRGAATTKAYVCVFVCMAVKAVHLELVSSLSTEHFLQAFRRFLARRGPCKELHSDRGTNFVGANGVLRRLYQLISSEAHNERLQRELLEQAVEWRFNPAAAPHMGGLWEASVKSVKTHIARVVGEQKLTYEEFTTLLTQIECLLNSRPLCAVSTDPDAPEALTPAHFLTLSPLRVLPIEPLTEQNHGRLNRFQLINQMVQGFWRRWRMEYLTKLQVRQKWHGEAATIGTGTVVVLKMENAPPLQWPLSVVTEVYPGKDGIVRVVKVKCGDKEFVRPVHKLCPLPNQ